MDPDTDTCDITAALPPGVDNPLPQYGELFKQRETMKQNTVTTNKNSAAQQKRLLCLKSPFRSKCIPKKIILPFKEQPETMGRYLEADYSSGISPGNLMKGVRVARGKVTFPGWLVELTDPQLQSLLDAKDILATGKPICDIYEQFYQTISGLGSGITEDTVKGILRRIPLTLGGWSFQHFMFIAGNPVYAKKKGIVQDPTPLEKVECLQQSSNSQSRTNVKHKKNVVDRLYQLPQISTPDDWPPLEADESSADDSGYTLKEQLFYSGLLYCEMYDTVNAIDELYLKGETIPESREKFLKRQQRAGFGVANLGTRKLGFAEWDRPLPPLPKKSPYIADLALVAKRRSILKPNGDVMMYRRSKTSLLPLFLTVQAPDKASATIKVLEDDKRVKSILDLLASKGNCVAMLPNVHCILHLSDTVLQKLQTENTQNGPLPPIIYSSNDELWITKEAKNLFRPHGIPAQISRIPPLITFTDGLKLREICKQVRDQHWSYICLRKTQFRDTVWLLMHVDRIPCGNLRESFVYSYLTYLPPKSHFPIIYNNALPW